MGDELKGDKRREGGDRKGRSRREREGRKGNEREEMGGKGMWKLTHPPLRNPPYATASGSMHRFKCRED